MPFLSGPGAGHRGGLAGVRPHHSGDGVRGPREADRAVGLGTVVLIRSIRPEGETEVELPTWLRPVGPDHVVVLAEEMGLHQLTTRTPLGRALLGARVGDVVSVRSQACTVLYEVLAIDPPASR